MKRIGRTILLTLPALVYSAQGELAVTELVPVRGGIPARICPGDNALKVSIALRRPAASPAAAAPRSATLRLSLVLPGGPPSGTLIAEGSAPLAPGATTTFTFLHVDVAERLRGRGARLVVRAEAERATDERELRVDDVTDWGCHG